MYNFFRVKYELSNQNCILRHWRNASISLFPCVSQHRLTMMIEYSHWYSVYLLRMKYLCYWLITLTIEYSQYLNKQPHVCCSCNCQLCQEESLLLLKIVIGLVIITWFVSQSQATIHCGHTTVLYCFILPECWPALYYRYELTRIHSVALSMCMCLWHSHLVSVCHFFIIFCLKIDCQPV